MLPRAPRVALALAVAAALAVSGCKGDARDRVPAPAPAPAGDARPPAPEDAAPGKPAPPPLTDAQRTAYRAELRAGRQLARKNQWQESAAAFERALAIVPTDPRALSELGWIAFKAGDYKRSAEASRGAIQGATSPAIRAASLYNLGRVEEARGDKTAAAAHYRESLRLRPGRSEVKERLAALGTAAPAAGSTGETPPCPGPMPRAELCTCAEAAARERAGAGETDCSLRRIRDSELELVVVGVVSAAGESTEWTYVAATGSGGTGLIATLGSAYRSGRGHDESIELGRVELHRARPGTVVWIETMKRTDDDNSATTEVYARTLTEATLCTVAKGRPPRCPVRLPLRDVVERNVTAPPSPDEGPEIKALRKAGLPHRSRTVFKLDVDTAGVATLTAIEGPVSDGARAVLGTHRLFP